MAATAIAKSPSCCARPAGWSTTGGSSGSGDARAEDPKIPARQPKRTRLWLSDGSCIRLRPEHPNHLWSSEFLEERTQEGGKLRLLNIIDEFTHECLATRVARRL